MTKQLKTKLLTALFFLIIVILVITGTNAFSINAYAQEANADQYAVETLDANSVLSTTKHNGVGLGINVITATSISDFSIGYGILNDDALQAMDTERMNLTQDTTHVFSTTSVKDLSVDYESSTTLNGSGEVGWASLAASITRNSSLHFSSYSFKYYHLLNEDIAK